MAEVFAGSTLGAEGFTRKVAIKRVLPGFSDNPQFAQMFVAEAQISARLVHPNIVSVLDFDRDADQRLFLVMELVEGRDLDQLASTGLLPYPVIIYAIAEVLRGLGYAHDLPVGGQIRGVIHRDVSPHNVLLSWEGAVKVSDFGIAKARAASEATASVFIKGKPAYMSPEQANGQALDGRSDLFAVGVMLWELVVGRRLFVGEDTRATLAAVLFGQIPRPRQLRPEVPKDLEKVVMKLLERDLPARYPSAEAAIVDLLACGGASQGGRDALIAILAERFPHDAPIRKNRSLSGGEPRRNAGTPSHLATTIPNGGTPPRSLAAVRAAPTVASPGRPNIALRVAVIIALVAVAGVGAYAIVSSVRGHRASVADAARASDAAVAHVMDAATDAGIDAPTDGAIDAPADAAPAKKSATMAPAMHPGTQKLGHLHVEGFPILTVYVDKQKLGDMPIDSDLPVGTHVLRLTTVGDDHVEHTVQTRTIQITEDATTKVVP